MTTGMQVYDSKHLIEQVSQGLYTGDIKLSPPPMEYHPQLQWNGAPIDRDTFRLALSFLKWTHDTFHCEGQARFWYNPETFQWKTVVLPQEKHGSAHTREVEEENDIKESVITALFEQGFGEAGTIHHHSNMGAFQSGGDLADELSRSGFHVTVGKMSNKTADFHARATFKGINYEQEKGMMTTGHWLPGLRTANNKGKHSPLDRSIANFWLSLEDLPEFPPIWKTYVVEAPKPTTNYKYQWNNYSYNNQWANNVGGRGAGTGYYQAHKSPMERNKEIHKHDEPVFVDKMYIVWLRKHTPRFRINVRIPKAQRDAIAASNEASLAKQNGIKTPESPNKAAEHGVPDGGTPMFSAADIRKINKMSAGECTEYIRVLQEENRVNSEGVKEEVENKFKEELVDLRTTYIGDQITGDGLDEVFTKLQRLTTRIVRMVQLTDLENESEGCPSGTEARDLIAVWIQKLASIIYEMHDEEWLALAEASCEVGLGDENHFYNLMCDTLEQYMDEGTVQDVYFPNGEVTDLFKRDAEKEAEDMADLRNTRISGT